MASPTSFYEKLRVAANTIMIANICIFLLVIAVYVTSNMALVFIFIPYTVLMLVFYYKSRHYRRDQQHHLVMVVPDTMPPMNF